MENPLPLLYFLLGFILLGAIVAVEARDLLSSVISVGAAGFGVALVFLILGAPDLAITQVVVEIVCLVILIRVVLTRRDVTYDAHRDAFSVAAGLVFIGAFLMACYFCYKGLIAFGSPQMTVAKQYLEGAIDQTGAANVVMAVLLDYRAYDTLGEATVIFVGIIGAYAILRKIGRKESEGSESDS